MSQVMGTYYIDIYIPLILSFVPNFTILYSFYTAEMEKVLSKANDLANEIATLEDGDENSDLKGILDQLRSAMKKRKSTAASSPASTSTSTVSQNQRIESEVFEVPMPVSGLLSILTDFLSVLA